MAAVVGRVRECPLLDVKLTLLSHNLVRGAAGAALLNAELLAARGFLNRGCEERKPGIGDGFALSLSDDLSFAIGSRSVLRK